MARNTQLQVLLNMLKGEIGSDLSSQVSPGGDSVMNQQLSNQQNWLATEYDWPFLEIRNDLTIPAGQRYTAMPLSGGNPLFELERPIKAECQWSNLWNPMELGITIYDYNTVNPDLGQTLVPIVKWQLYNVNGFGTQFEVWPVPSMPLTVRLTGQGIVPALVNPTDTAVLDDMLIVLFTAAQLMARFKQADAQAMAARAQSRLNKIRQGYPKPNGMFVVSDGQQGWRKRDWSKQPTVATMISGPQ